MTFINDLEAMEKENATSIRSYWYNQVLKKLRSNAMLCFAIIHNDKSDLEHVPWA